ncbi:MAG: DUF4965 domain-containing protein [Clostridia bacterium]|nr:DUF4965 domain-containing protein [Clostridia bacterium]
MKMRPPSIPIITIDPYFTVWSPSNILTDTDLQHWSAKSNTIKGYVTVDGEKYRFMGTGEAPSMTQTAFNMSATVTDYVFENANIKLELSFFSTPFTDDLYRLSRPVSYMTARFTSLDGKSHNVSLRIAVSEEICINLKGEEPVATDTVMLPCGRQAMKMGSVAQRVLWRSGDDLRIDWGYFYLSSDNKNAIFESRNADEMTYVSVEAPMTESKNEVVTFAYDDIHSFNYFGHDCDAYWKSITPTIEAAISEAMSETGSVLEKCRRFALDLENKATECGGEKYADLVSLAYRQVLAAHKLALDDYGELIYVSKECFSGGHSCTVDVTYPASPFMLLYNVELLKATLRPIFRFAATDKWKYDFAPHDAGSYPILGTQRYGLREGGVLLLEMQMPVEECGNILILMENIILFEGKTDYVAPHMDTLAKWAKYLIQYGNDPENQLCSDDFAGHLAHNCNLALKAIMGIAAYSMILKAFDSSHEAEEYMNIAREMAKSWVERAQNENGSFRLTFDKPGTRGMKYNLIWDKLWGTNLFPKEVYASEFAVCLENMNPYGLPFDSLHTYTKTDWLVWTAMLGETREEFEELIAPLWLCYNLSLSRVPMNDFYDTVTSLAIGCRHRSVVGGIFIKLLEEKLASIQADHKAE